MKFTTQPSQLEW